MRLLLPLFLLAFSLSATAQNFSNGFPFHMPWDDTSTQSFLPQFPRNPINDSSFININPSGHFDLEGKRMRFWGANLVASACFPDTADAGLIAGRMRKMGFNLMRFHHMDNPWTDSTGSLFIPGKSTRNLNPTTLDQFEFLISKMKQEGVYANINLNVSRTFNSLDGVVDADSLPTFGKGVTLFDPQLIALQKEYATQLLTHVNPYTGLSLIDDPVMAMLEVVNENSLYRMWKFDELKPFAQGGKLTQRHSDMLDSLWIDFLQKKYDTQADLDTSWNTGAGSQVGTNSINNGDFETNPLWLAWDLELHSNALAAFTQEINRPFHGNQSCKLTVMRPTGTDWHIQLKQTGLSVQKDSIYQVHFAARADTIKTLRLTMMRDDAPYTVYQSTDFRLDTTWQQYTLAFKAAERNIGDVRLSFSFLNQAGVFWIDDVMMGSRPQSGLPAGQDLLVGTVQRIPYRERFITTPNRIADQTEFYIDLQTRFNLEMKAFLRDTLGVKIPITSNNALTGPGELMSQSVMDYIDDHAYWDHPQFPNEPWSGTDWRIDNTPMLKADFEEATVAGLFAGYPMEGKPYTISEYRHPFPNRYEAEMMIWMLAYGSFHDADAIMFYEYNGEKSSWKQDYMHSYFSMHRNAALMAMNISCAYAFRKEMIRPGGSWQTHTIEYDSTTVFQLPIHDLEGNGWAKEVPFDRRIALEHRVITKGFQGTSAPDWSALPSPSGNTWIDNGSTRWISSNYGALSVDYDEYAATMGDKYIGTWSLSMQNQNNFGLVSTISLDRFDKRKLLMTVVSESQNANMTWQDTTSINNNWGSSPTTYYPFETEIYLSVYADTLKITPLDERGVQRENDAFYVKGPQTFNFTVNTGLDSTLWYSIEAFGDGWINIDDPLSLYQLKSFPNPVSEQLHLQFELSYAEDIELVIHDLSGRQLLRKSLSNRIGLQRETLDVSQLAAGVYQIHLMGERGRAVRKFVKTN